MFAVRPQTHDKVQFLVVMFVVIGVMFVVIGDACGVVCGEVMPSFW